MYIKEHIDLCMYVYTYTLVCMYIHMHIHVCINGAAVKHVELPGQGG